MKYLISLLALLGFAFIAVAQTVPVAKTIRTIAIKKRQIYLNLPVNPASPLASLQVKYAGMDIEMAGIRLSDTPSFWTFLDVSHYQGKEVTIQAEDAQPNDGSTPGTIEAVARALNMVYAGKQYPGHDSVYQEQGRPQVHFSTQRGFLNDPNGLIYYNNEYHLYYQHNPYGNEINNQHWGHAVSKDLLHWQQLAEAIYPYYNMPPGKTDLAFSGTATIDTANTAGFRKHNIDPLIVFYTSTGRGVCIKMSYDNGRSFTDYEGNPILQTQGRDPKIFWYAPGKHWVMVVWDGGKDMTVRQNLIYTSPDMKVWTYRCSVPGFFECPDFFELPVEDSPGVSKWVMSGANGRYMIGDFDGKYFNEEQMQPYVYGGAYYAGQTFSNMPGNRHVQISWGRCNFPGMPFTQAMCFPVELKLKKVGDGLRLCPTPIRELSLLYKSNQLVENRIVTQGHEVSLLADADKPVYIKAEYEKGSAPVVLNIMGYEIKYDTAGQLTFASSPVNGINSSDTISATKTPSITIRYVQGYTNTFKIEAIVDKNMLEVYINDGEAYWVSEFTGTKTGKIALYLSPANNIEKTGGASNCVLKKLEVHELNSIWP